MKMQTALHVMWYVYECEALLHAYVCVAQIISIAIVITSIRHPATMLPLYWMSRC